MSSCYGCGSLEHSVAARKAAVQLVDQNEYVKYFKFCMNSSFNDNFFLECLIDSGSPVSFVRESSILNRMNINELLVCTSAFFEINKS